MTVRRSSCEVPVIFCQIPIKPEFSRHFSEKYTNFKLKENPSSRRRVVLGGRKDKKKLTAAFHSFAKQHEHYITKIYVISKPAPQHCCQFYVYIYIYIYANIITLFTYFTPLTPNDPYRGRTAPLTSKRCILYIYSTNIITEYFKHGIHSPFFFLFKMQFVS